MHRLPPSPPSVTHTSQQAPPHIDLASSPPLALVGQHHDPNYRHRRSMEDETVVEHFDHRFPGLFLAVYDGHGGKQVASLLRQMLHRFFLNEILSQHSSPLHPTSEPQCDTASVSVAHQKPQPDLSVAFTSAYAKMDALLKLRHCCRVGATSVTCFLRNVPGVGRVLTTANCGDSRAVLSRGRRAVRLSEDHRPVDDEERKRIEKAGGFVAWARVNGVLNVSRAFGDHCMKSVIISTPAVKQIILEPSDEFVVLACDGLWDFVDDKSVIQIAQEAFDQGMNADQVAKLLVKQSIQESSTDNVSVMVVRLDLANES